MGSLSWCMLGDFNAVISPEEIYFLGRQVVKDLNMTNLECLLNDLKMLHHPASGCFFTWSNKRVEDFQCRKLDRIVENDTWIDLPNFSKAFCGTRHLRSLSLNSNCIWNWELWAKIFQILQSLECKWEFSPNCSACMEFNFSSKSYDMFICSSQNVETSSQGNE